MPRAAAAARTKPVPARSSGKSAHARRVSAAKPARATAKPARRAPQRRVSGPARGLKGRTEARGPRVALAGAAAAIPAGGAAVLRSPFGRLARLRTGRVLDALLTGRGWIALVFVLLAGIVFFNVDLLQLNRQIAVNTEKAAGLKRSNAELRLQLARLGSTERIQEAAAELGFVLPAPGDVRYLRAGGIGDAERAARRMGAPEDIVLVPVVPEAPIEEPVAAPTEPTATDPALTDPAATDPAALPTDPAAATPTEPVATPPPAGQTGGPTAPPAG